MQRALRFQWVLAENDPEWPDIATQAELAAHRLVRLTWLSVLLLRDHPPLYRDYRRRFGVTMHTFCRDKRKLRRIGMYVDSLLHGKVSTLLYLERMSLGVEERRTLQAARVVQTVSALIGRATPRATASDRCAKRI